MKSEIDIVDASPSKRLYLSIIADYDIKKSLCELIDNAIDIWTKAGSQSNLTIDIVLDRNQQRIEVTDNAGGIKRQDLPIIVGPGRTLNTGTDETIGIFGVGTKRAVVALAQNISIRSRAEDDTLQIEFDDSWINAEDDWNLPVYQVDSIGKGQTTIELTKLRRPILDETSKQLHEHLGATYARFLENKNLALRLDGVEVVPILFEDWAYPPGYEPRQYSGPITSSDSRIVNVEATAGLCLESSPASGEYGVYFYCNNRLIARAMKTQDVGFIKGLAGKPHADISLARVIVALNGDAQLMPWNSSKSEINTSSEIFEILRNWLIQVVKDYTSLSRRLSKAEGGWPETVFKYKSGSKVKENIESFPDVNTSYLPPLPLTKPRYAKTVEEKNAALAVDKPWVVGLYESMIVVDWILKQKLTQKNRLALIVLDSTLEIAFKEYLVHETGQRIGPANLRNVTDNRINLQNEVAKTAQISQTSWSKVDHLYNQRCLLIHERTSVSISDQEINNFKQETELILNTLFGLTF